LAARREETSELTEALPRMTHATNQVDGRDYLESTIRKGGQIRGIAHLKFDAASPQRARQNQSARAELRYSLSRKLGVGSSQPMARADSITSSTDPPSHFPMADLCSGVLHHATMESWSE